LGVVATLVVVGAALVVGPAVVEGAVVVVVGVVTAVPVVASAPVTVVMLSSIASSVVIVATGSIDTGTTDVAALGREDVVTAPRMLDEDAVATARVCWTVDESLAGGVVVVPGSRVLVVPGARVIVVPGARVVVVPGARVVLAAVARVLVTPPILVTADARVTDAVELRGAGECNVVSPGVLPGRTDGPGDVIGACVVVEVVPRT